MKVLVTGGAGYIGSHTCIELLRQGHEVVVMDDFSNSSEETMYRLFEITGKVYSIVRGDVTNTELVDLMFRREKFDAVMHFAGKKSVKESIEDPMNYYKNNVYGTVVIAEACRKFNVDRFVFSSSATVYGDNEYPYEESMEVRPSSSPYGTSKAMCEQVLRDLVKAVPEMGVVLLRYFNPIGAHSGGLIGEEPSGIPNNLMPYVTQVAKGKLDKLMVYGDDYDTVDGTGVRDYVHVVDLAKGHVAALTMMHRGVSVYNLGTGKGTSVLELVKAFEKENGIKIDYEIVERRAGDLPEYYADVRKAHNELGWKAELSIEDMVRDAWQFEKHR